MTSSLVFAISKDIKYCDWSENICFSSCEVRGLTQGPNDPFVTKTILQKITKAHCKDMTRLKNKNINTPE